MTILATEPATPDPTPATTEADPSTAPTDGTPPASTEEPTPAPYAKGDLVKLETSWPYPSETHLLVVGVDDRGWIRCVTVSAPTGYMPPDTVSAD